MNDVEIIGVLKALADATRFRVVQEIAAAGELTCGALVDKLELSQPTISHHLKILADAGIIVVRLEGKHHFVSVNHALLGRLGSAVPLRLGPGAAARTGRLRGKLDPR